MKAQGAVEYIIILGVIILIALIVVASLGGLGIFKFSTTAQTRTTEIANRLSDVGLTYILNDNGGVQVAIRSTVNKNIIAYNLTWYNSTGGAVCIVDFGGDKVSQSWKTYSNSSCTALAGTAGDSYSFDCTIRYKDSLGMVHAVKGKCEGIYEES